MSHLPPLLETPLTRPTYHWLTHQQGRCSELEMDYLRCAARVGGQRTVKECKTDIDDFLECVFRTKQNSRFVIMQAERRRQKRPSPPSPPKDILN